jgi:Thiamine monophosphate synthase
MSLVFPPLYAIIDAALLKTSELSFAEMMAESGVELLQYRNKRATSRQLFEASESISAKLSRFARTGDYHPRFIVNDRADIAFLVKAQGVHVGQEDLSVDEAHSHNWTQPIKLPPITSLSARFFRPPRRKILIPWSAWLSCARLASALASLSSRSAVSRWSALQKLFALAPIRWLWRAT